ncbi:hypothetical protein [Niabella aquatica]
MNNLYHYTRYSISLALLFLLISGCYKDKWREKSAAGPEIKIEKQFEAIQGINVGEEIKIPVTVTSSEGVKRLSYFFVTQTANGTASGTPVHVDKKDYPSTFTQDISFKIAPAMLELVIVSFDKNNNSSEAHIKMSDIRNLPVISFRDNIKYVERVFVNRVLAVEGTVISDYNITSLTYKTVVDGVISPETNISVPDPKNVPFKLDILVPNDLTDIIITAKNIHNGMAVDTFKIGEVGNLALEGGKTSIDILYADNINSIKGTIVSASEITKITYAVKSSGIYGAEQNVSFTPADEINFTADVMGIKGAQAIRFSTTNNEGRVQHYEMPVLQVYTPLLRFKNVTLTSEIGAGKNNWMGFWKAPNLFDIPSAAANHAFVDIGLIRHQTGFRIVTPSLYNVAGYDVSIAPYMDGFTTATYTLVTSFRGKVTAAAMDTILYDKNMENFINNNIKGPTPVGENYNVTNAYRRLSDNIVATSVNRGFVIGWGTRVGDTVIHEAYGLAVIKSVSISGTVCTLTLDITVPKEDMRTRFNAVSSFNLQ